MKAAGHQVVSTSHSPEKSAVLAELGVEAARVDVYDSAALQQAIHGCDAVVRLTTRIPPLSRMRSASAWDENNRLRTIGARALANACIAERTPICAGESVAFIYADGGDRLLDVSAPVDDAGEAIIGAAVEGERQVQRASEYGGRAIVLRFGALYSPDDPQTLAMARLLRRRLLPQIGESINYVSPLFTRDAGAAVAASLDAPAGVYNVCDDEPLRLKEYMDAAVSALGAAKPFKIPGWLGPLLFGAPWRYVSRSQRVSNAAFKRAAGWAPSVPRAGDGWRLIADKLG
jgi:nucleoside-diphosphate-sugar epimerase